MSKPSNAAEPGRGGRCVAPVAFALLAALAGGCERGNPQPAQGQGGGSKPAATASGAGSAAPVQPASVPGKTDVPKESATKAAPALPSDQPAAVPGASKPEGAGPAPAGGGVPAARAVAQTLERGPFDYFAEHCARCHGLYGRNYGPSFGANLDLAHLRQMVRMMAEGPGAAPLSGAPFEAQVAWHEALAKKQPFIALLTLEPLVTGEASPGAKVSLEVVGEPASPVPGADPIGPDAHAWSLDAGQSARLRAALAAGKPVRLVATLGGATARLDPTERAYAKP